MEDIRRSELLESQSRLFYLMSNKNLDIVDAANKFMKSSIVKEIDKYFSTSQLDPANIWLEQLENEFTIKKSKDKYNIEAIRWLGYFYRKWHFLTGEPSYKIVRYLSPINGLKAYYTYHQLDENRAIELIKGIYNSSRNVHRKYEIKTNYLNSKNIFNYDIRFLSYLSKKVLYKLTNDEKFKKYRFDNKDKVFNHNKTIYKTLLINKVDNLIEYIKRNKLNKIVNNNKSNVLFIYISNKRYKDLYKDVSYISNNNLLGKYDYVYIYSFGSIYEINGANEINKYYIPISKRDISGINREIKLDKLYDEIDEKLKWIEQ